MNWSEESCFQYPARDAELFAKWTEGLPLRAPETPFHVGPHSLRSMRMIYDLIKPNRLLEIGFCVGFSSSCWLNLGVDFVTSIDISNRFQTEQAAGILREKYPSRFLFRFRDVFDSMAASGKAENYDAIFIDGGGHEQADAEKDIELGLSLGIKRFIFDDWQKSWGPGVQAAIAKFRLIHVCITGNMSLCITPDGWGDL